MKMPHEILGLTQQFFDSSWNFKRLTCRYRVFHQFWQESKGLTKSKLNFLENIAQCWLGALSSLRNLQLLVEGGWGCLTLVANVPISFIVLMTCKWFLTLFTFTIVFGQAIMILLAAVEEVEQM